MTHDETSEVPTPVGPPARASPVTMNRSSPVPTRAWSRSTVKALSLPVKPPVDITARPVVGSIREAVEASVTATSHVAVPWLATR